MVPTQVKATTYYTDYQGVRFIVLDGTAAIDLGAMKAQTDWLDATLASSKANWNVVLFHQPVFTCARPNDTAEIKAAWKPVFEKRKVDLVLQGHDHCYSRPDRRGRPRRGRKGARRRRACRDPVYLVSVTGSKMYALNDRARARSPTRSRRRPNSIRSSTSSRSALEFRTYHGFGQALRRLRSRTGRPRATVARPKSANRRLPHVRCSGETGPDGGRCVARGK